MTPDDARFLERMRLGFEGEPGPGGYPPARPAYIDELLRIVEGLRARVKELEEYALADLSANEQGLVLERDALRKEVEGLREEANKPKGEISDGYHTFNELYEHRVELFIALMLSHPEKSWRSKLHDDGGGYPGWFIAGMNLGMGQITYHLPEKVWYRLDDRITTLEKAPKWDGHTPKDVISRLLAETYEWDKGSAALKSKLAEKEALIAAMNYGDDLLLSLLKKKGIECSTLNEGIEKLDQCWKSKLADAEARIKETEEKLKEMRDAYYAYADQTKLVPRTEVDRLKAFLERIASGRSERPSGMGNDRPLPSWEMQLMAQKALKEMEGKNA